RGLEEELAAGVDGAGVEGVGGQAGVPVEAEPAAFRRSELGVASLYPRQVEAPGVPPLPLGIEVVGIEGVGADVEAVARAHEPPLVAPDAAALRDGVGPAPGAVVLQTPIDVVGVLHVDGHVL